METPVTKDPKEILHSMQQIASKNQFIYLYVDTIRLYNDSTEFLNLEMDENCKLINEYCVLEDEEHSSKGWPLSHFTSEVFINKEVKWEGIAADHGYSVSIEKIEFQDNPACYKNFFNSSIIEEQGPGVEKEVAANVKNDPGLVHWLYNYFIYFRINGPKGDKDYVIDPKLCGNN